jgi:2-phosphosulfolactate phosphatase
MEIHVIEKAEKISNYDLQGSQLVAIDVLRATSTMVTAFKNGALKIIPVMKTQQAFNIKKNNSQVILGGERGGVKISGFHLGNSPAEYTPENVYGKTIVMTTTNGTRLIQNSLAAESIYIGCLLNAKAVAEKLNKTRVFLACAGTRGYFSPEDFMAAGAIAWHLTQSKNVALNEKAKRAVEFFKAVKNRAEFLKLFPHGNLLIQRGFEKDISYCCQLDTIPVVPRYYCGSLYV